MRLLKPLMLVLAVIFVLGGVLELMGWPVFRTAYWVVTTYPQRHADEKAAPHDLVLRHVSAIRRSELSAPDARDLQDITDLSGTLLRIEFTSRVDFQAYIFRTKYRSVPYLGPCKDGEPADAMRAFGVFDRYGQIDSDAEWYSSAPPGSSHPILAHPRSQSSGPPDGRGLFTYVVYLPVDGKSVAEIKGFRDHPVDLCFFVEDLKAMFPGYQTNSVAVPKATIMAALDHAWNSK